MSSALPRLRALWTLLFLTAGCSLFLDWKEPPGCGPGALCEDGFVCVSDRCQPAEQDGGAADGGDGGSVVPVDGGPFDAGPPARDAGTRSVGNLGTPRARPEAVRLASGQVFITGGYSGGWHKTSEVFTPESDTWSVGPSLLCPGRTSRWCSSPTAASW